MNLAGILGRVPRVWLFAAAGLLQIVLIGLLVADRVHVLRVGTEIKLQTRPVDPRDFLRGDYVALSYDISTVPGRGIEVRAGPRKGATVYVRLTPNEEGFYRAVSVDEDPIAVTSPDVLIRGRVVSTTNCGGTQNSCNDLLIRYGIESYFVPQGEGHDIEQARNHGKVAIVAAVTPSGRAAIKRLLIDGKPVYDEPLF